MSLRILIVNRNFFIAGGPEKYLFSLMRIMNGHEFVPFCLNFRQSHNTPYRTYFLDPPGGADNLYVQDFRMSLLQKVSFAFDMIYYREARNRLDELIFDSKPDVAFFLNVVHFTDSIIDACRSAGVPIVWRLSDFNKVCANYLLYRDGKVCEDCIHQGLYKAIVHRCGGYQRSRTVAFIKTIGMWLARLRRAYDYVSYFVTPTKFTRQKMIDGGFSPEKVVHIPTFVSAENPPQVSQPKKPGILYVGRLSHEKGVNILIRAFASLRNREATLTIVGESTGPFAQELIRSVSDINKPRITFLGFQSQGEIDRLFSEHTVFVVPSLWYENLPNVVLEGMAHGKPAIVSRLGGLTETVQDGVTGLYFEPGNDLDLADKLDQLLDNPERVKTMGMRAYEYVRTYHTPEEHISRLEAIFAKSINAWHS